MAPPPKYLITRKLVKRFFDNYLPKEPLYAYEESQKMFECWMTHGFESQKCKEYELLYDNVYDETKAYRRKLNSMNFKSTVLQTLRKPEYRNQQKGRYKERWDLRERDIFDGVN